MALVLQTATFAHQYLNSFLYSQPKKSADALKLGVLSSAQINAAAIIHPVETHPHITLYGIASRNQSTAQSQAKKYHFKQAYGSYQALLDDPEVDVVYISTPNGQHLEWTMKAINAGKHVLCEKPFMSNGEEARKVVELAKEKGVVVEEAFHWQFHPAAHRFRALLESGEYGRILRTKALMTASPGVPEGDIRWQYDLAGGSAMDMTYALSFTRYALETSHPKHIHSVAMKPYNHDPRVDEAMYAYLTFEASSKVGGGDVQSQIYTDMARSWTLGIIPRFWEYPSIEVETEKAIIYFYNAMMPHLYHYISVKEKLTGRLSTYRQYAGGPVWGSHEVSVGGKGGKSGWSTYRWQLEAFVEKVRGGNPPVWVENEESVVQMEVIDQLYRAAGMPVRGEKTGSQGGDRGKRG
ncbi:Gfo/Idh/MocA family protein [Aspergillus foveolatus]|uniref:Gfo/Idh/MocA family protein n=1 Tax=Aspergillus foveolatus TaxID=210207 RepID=UPI003CCDFD13